MFVDFSSKKEGKGWTKPLHGYQMVKNARI
jgi:hypothetical protein